jgi:hypothetical protein
LALLQKSDHFLCSIAFAREPFALDPVALAMNENARIDSARMS